MKVLNCTQHTLTNEQLDELENDYNADLFLDLKDDNAELFGKLSNMKGDENLMSLALEFLDATKDADYYILPIGTPAFVFALGRASMELEHDEFLESPFLFSFSERVVSEIKNEDGSVSKTSIFKHKKFLQV